ncbi:MAG: proP 7 [Rickettsiaceae bacterium]|jgi:MFS family permease|nr:proP 7 [Rickettsiaceae bacterium]
MHNKKPYLIALAATVINSYDYALFGLTAARLSKEFFPGDKEIDALFKYFIVYATTLIIRPFASLFFGMIGDRHGRATVLRMGSVGIALPALFIAFIPPYNTIGYVSTLLFITCRILIITFLAGEADGIRIYIYEKLSEKRKFFGSGLVTGCSQGGSLIAAFAAWFSGLDFLPEYAWRFNFFIGGVCGLTILYLRESFQETEEFLEYRKVERLDPHQKISFTHLISENISSLSSIIKENFTAFVRSTLIQGAIGGIYHFHIIFYSLYAISILKLQHEDYIEFIRLLTIFAYMCSAIFSGLLHDRFKPKIIASTALILSILLSLINMKNIANSNFNPWPIILIGALTPLHTTALFVFLKQQFQTGVKYRLFGFTHSLGSVLISSTTPIIAIKIWETSHVKWLPIIYLITLMSFLLWQVQSKNFGTGVQK